MIDERNDGAGVIRIDKGIKVLRKSAPVPLCPPQIPHELS
jgi:hypothetical protein